MEVEVETEKENKYEPKHPYERAGILSRLLFLWIVPFVRLGASKNLTLKDFYPNRKVDVAQSLGIELEIKWKEELELSKKRGKSPSLFRVLWKMFRKSWIWPLIGTFVIELTIYVALPILVRWFILSFGDSRVTRAQQFLYAGAVCVCTILFTLGIHSVFLNLQLISVRVRVAVISLIFRKSMRLSTTGKEPVTLGHILNLCANDVGQFDDFLFFSTYLFVAPCQIIIYTYILLEEIGYPPLVGIGLVISFLPLQYFVGKYTGKYREEQAQRTDERARFMNEIINGIRVIKMYAWEIPFSVLIHQLRNLEVQAIKKLSYVKGANVAFSLVAIHPILLSVILAYILTGNEISSDKVFYAITIYVVLVNSMLWFVPYGIMGVSSAIITKRRIEAYLIHDEIQMNGITIQNTNLKPMIQTQNLYARWTDDKMTLNNLNFVLGGDQVVIIVGPVGSGKSSILKMLIGELGIHEGNCLQDGTISYASQLPWIFTGSIRENIIFGRTFDETRYKRVIEACALRTDFLQFENGDGTLVGERGITLSGGQKARINLARCLYRKSDIYLLDDPLSAVDTKISKHIFEKAIKSFTRGHLRILVTHQLQYLPKANYIIVLNNEGEICAQGSYAELHGKELESILKNCGGSEEDPSHTTEAVQDIPLGARRFSRSPSIAISHVDLSLEDEMKIFGEEELEDESIAYGSVGGKTYSRYFSSSKSTCSTIAVFLGFILVQVLLSCSYLWLSFWTNSEDARQQKLREYELSDDDSISEEGIILDEPHGGNHYMYLWIYAILTLASAAAVIAVTLAYYKYIVEINVNIHDQMFKSLVRAPTRFYDTNPPGRVLNRATRDVSQMDGKLPEILYDTVYIILRIIGTVIIVIIVNYYITIPTAIIAIFFYFVRKYYVQTIRDVKRIEAISRSPIYTHLASSFEGISTIRSSECEKVAISQFEKLVDENTKCMIMYWCTARWFGVWLELSAGIYLSIITFGFLLLTTSSLPGDVGMAMASIMELTFYFQWGMRQSSELENTMTAVERIQEYSDLTPEASLNQSDSKLPKQWIQRGEIKFESVSLAYDEKKVLKNLNFSIKSQEKIGIVGRTGAGKSSIITAMFRLTEPTGRIYIDGICINEIGLHELRENISIIPQEPILFSGTIRFNLDPFQQFNDSDIWRAIQEVSLRDLIVDLDTIVYDGGANFSIGERQLICLARAILRRNKVILMDEATANVDLKTDAFIQKTIREQFVSATIITIAHKLQTVMDSDRILVLEHGEIKEFDHPFKLLQNPNGFLKSLIQTN